MIVQAARDGAGAVRSGNIAFELACRLAAVAVGLAAPAAWSDEGAPERVIRYERDTLTVHVTSMPVTEVLDELGRQSGAKIQGQMRDPRVLSVEFEAVPLADALHRLLGDQNFALVYGNEGQLKSVRLLGGPQAVPAAPATAAASPANQPAAPASVMDALANHPPIPVTGRLGDVIGGHDATLLQLADLGVHHADATVRAQAARAFIAAVDTDPTLRASVLTQLNAMDEGTLSNLLRNAAGAHAEEVAMQILANARATEIRSKASAVLQRLRAGG